jgi:hypothetical protein
MRGSASRVSAAGGAELCSGGAEGRAAGMWELWWLQECWRRALARRVNCFGIVVCAGWWWCWGWW